MAIEVRSVDNSWGIWNGYNMDFINPQYLSITERDISKYVGKYPFPKDDNYSLEDCINDLTQSDGAYTIYGERSTAEYISDMIRALI